MLGVFIALGASLAWAGSSILLKYLSSRIDAIAVNMMRLWVGMMALIILVFAVGRAGDILHTPLLPILLVVASGILSNAIGDTISFATTILKPTGSLIAAYLGNVMWGSAIS